MRFLIAEDDPIYCQIMMGMLTPYVNCDEAKNGKDAVEAFKRAIKEGKPYDLILMDIIMPEMNGQEAVKEIRRLEEEEMGLDYPKGIKIIMTTSLDDYRNIVDAFRSLCNAYLLKPIDGELLFNEICSFFPSFAKELPTTKQSG
jgi:two-component system, chemotaxis family, chemotaxis protein CheY